MDNNLEKDLHQSVREDIEAAKEATIRFAAEVGNATTGKPSVRTLTNMIDATIAALQTRIDILQRLKESL